MAQFPWLFALPLLAPLCPPFVLTWHPPSCDRNRPPRSQVASKLTPFAPPFTQPTPPLQIPRTPTAQRLNKTTSGIFRLLLSGTVVIGGKITRMSKRTARQCCCCHHCLVGPATKQPTQPTSSRLWPILWRFSRSKCSSQDWLLYLDYATSPYLCLCLRVLGGQGQNYSQ